MREKLNSNPIYQAAALGVLGLLVAFMLLTRMGGGGGAETETADPVPATSAGEASTTTDPSAAPVAPTTSTPAPAVPAEPIAPPPVGGGSAKQALKPGPGLPEEIVNAYDSGDKVVLLITNANGIDDKRLRPAVDALRSTEDVNLTVVPVGDVAKYSRITRGVSLNRTPALIVVESKARAGTGLPEATVSYGYRGPGSVDQTVRDIAYNGKDVGYDPN